MFFVGNRFFQLIIAATGRGIAREDRDLFFDSFQVLE
jgi:hypothetical protein